MTRGAGDPGAPEPRVLVIGDVCSDLILRLPLPGSGIPDCPDPVVEGGGTGGNTAIALARLGIPTAFVGTVGDDGFGRMLRAELDAEGVRTEHLGVARDAFTALVTAVVDPAGERTVFSWPARGAAHTRLTPEAVDAARPADARWVHASGMCLVEPPVSAAVLHAMSVAREAGVPVSLDLNLRLGVEDGILPPPFRATLERAIELADYVLGSGPDEIVHLGAGADGAGGDGVGGDHRAAAAALAGDRRVVVARLGAMGAEATARGRLVAAPAFDVPVVDTVGAGDVFDAGFIAALVEGRSLDEGLRWGNGAAALKLGRSGGRGSPRRGELEALLARAPHPRRGE